jgi:hypothetical protein
MAWLMLAGAVPTHEYTMFKSVVTSLSTILGIAAVLFLAMVFYSAVSQLISFFVNIATEIRYW